MQESGDKNRVVSPPAEDDLDSTAVMTVAPDDVAYTARQAAAFENAFYSMLNDTAAGALTSYLFFDLPRRSGIYGKGYDPVKILSGGRAWERRTAENAASAEHEEHNFGGDDKRIVQHSIENGLLNFIPLHAHLISYGGGDVNTFLSIDGQILDAIAEDPTRYTSGFCAVDILPRYAQSLAYLVSDHYSLHAQGVRGDFLRNGRLAIAIKSGTPVIMNFGGSLENVSVDAQRPDADMNAAIAWGKMNRQHGIGSVVIKTFDSDQNPENQNKKYAPTSNFAAFELSAFARAATAGIIKNSQYDVLRHWQLASMYNEDLSRQELRAECRVAHVMETTKGDYPFEVGDNRMILTLSHKWDLARHNRNIERAGGEIVQAYQQPGNPNQLIVVKFVREPDADIKAFIPY